MSTANMEDSSLSWEHSAKAECISRALGLPVRTKVTVEAALGAKFVSDFPHVTAMLSNPDADMAQLVKFVDLAASVASGTVTEHQASVAVGQVLADQYLTR